MLRALPAIILLLCVSACDRDVDSRQDVAPVTVYAAHSQVPALETLFESFTEETDIRVGIKAGTPELIVDAVIANNGSPPADALLTEEIAQIWRAAEEGGLRAVRSDVISAAVASRLHDPENLWFGFRYRKAAIAVDSRSLDPSAIEDYAALADSRLRGHLCLSSSALAVNRALIALLIADLGVRPAEILVRGWKANLARPVLPTETALLEAMQAGSCRAGIVSSDVFDAYATANPDSSLRLVTLRAAHILVEGIGVARHARNPAGAQRLVEWLVARTELTDTALVDVSARNVGIAGWYDEDAVKLSERAGYP